MCVFKLCYLLTVFHVLSEKTFLLSRIKKKKKKVLESQFVLHMSANLHIHYLYQPYTVAYTSSNKNNLENFTKWSFDQKFNTSFLL